MISQRVLNNLNAMNSVNGEIYREVDLPEDISSRDYTVIMEDDLIVDVSGNEYRFELPANQNFRGQGSGKIRIFKNSSIVEMADV
jgi:mRNA-degrading endonuclease HigB of HigAB toxin-antitoxin module